MFGRINRLWRDEHHEAQRNLPWRYSGDLDASAIARFDAHLETCAQCRADLQAETKLRSLAERCLDPDAGWAEMTKRLAPRTTRILPSRPLPAAGLRWQPWAIAAQFLVIFGLTAALLMPRAQPAQFHALSAAPQVEAGNLLVMFSPQIAELSMRRVLQQADARVVDGPNAAGAYVLRVPAERRASLLTTLKNRSEVILAEPIDSGAAP
jgi:anti-sigma factor RsiW